MIKRIFTVSLLCLGAAVSAQQTVLGKVTQVQGVVTVSDGVTIGTAVPGTVITEGNRFLTASSGAARLTMDNGCVISLKPNESITIGSNMTCRQLLAAVQSVGTNTGAAGTGLGAGGGTGTGLAVAGGVLLAAGLASGGGGSSGGTAGGGGGGIPVVPISGQ